MPIYKLTFMIFALGGTVAAAGLTLPWLSDRGDLNQVQDIRSSQLRRAIRELPEDTTAAERILEDLGEEELIASDWAKRNYVLAQLEQGKNNTGRSDHLYDAIDTSQVPNLADRVLLHRMEIDAQLGREADLLSRARRLIALHPDSMSVPAAHYEMARSFLRQGEKDRAKVKFEFVENRYSDHKLATAANYYLGEITGDDSYWSQYLEAAPAGQFASVITDQWLSRTDTLSSYQRSILGASLYMRGKQAAAAPLLAADLNRYSWLPLAKSQLSRGLRRQALDTLEAGLLRYSDSEVYRDGLRLYLRNASLARRRDLISRMSGFDAARVPELLWYQSINTPSPDREGLWRRLTREHVDNSYSAKASAQLFWRAYQNEYWDLAFELGRQHLDQYPRAKASAKVRFWMGKLHEREGNRQDASRLYSQLLSQNGYSYYALRAKGRLGQLAGAYDPGWSLEHEATELSASDNKGWPLPRAEIMGMHPTMRELMNLNLWQEVIGLLPRDYEERYPALNAWFKGRVAGYPADAIAAASGNLDAQQRNDELLQLAYPMLHGDDVLRAAEKHGVDPLLLFALIRQESRFQPQVESRSGAIGLCQLMPATAREVARRLGESYPSRSKLEDPTYNIELGAKYLSDLMRAFQGQPQLAVAAYNGGPGSVRSWLRRYGRIDPDMFVEKIPYAETRHYVKAVFENYWVYKRLHADSDPALELAAAS